MTDGKDKHSPPHENLGLGESSINILPASKAWQASRVKVEIRLTTSSPEHLCLNDPGQATTC